MGEGREPDEVFIVQARPETVQSRRKADAFRSCSLKERSGLPVKGLAVGQAIAAGAARVLQRRKRARGMTDPDRAETIEEA